MVQRWCFTSQSCFPFPWYNYCVTQRLQFCPWYRTGGRETWRNLLLSSNQCCGIWLSGLQSRSEWYITLCLIVPAFTFLLYNDHVLSPTVPPRIEHFSFREGLSEGMRTRVVCGIYQGDQPLILTWLREGSPLHLSGLPSIQVKAIDQFSSVLIIGPLSAEHAGRYTCRANNAAGSVEASADLSINGKVMASQWKAYQHHNSPS